MLIRRTETGMVKEAETTEDRHRLAREVDVLKGLAHPGVVAVIDCDGEEGLVDRSTFQLVPGPTLAGVGSQPVPAVVGWGAAVATIVADLHDLGWVHGRVCAEHVILDEEGRPVLCGFGSARRASGQADGRAARESDVKAVARLVLAMVPDSHPLLRRRLASWSERRRWRHGGARGLAMDLVRQVPDAYVGPPYEMANGPDPGTAQVADASDEGASQHRAGQHRVAEDVAATHGVGRRRVAATLALVGVGLILAVLLVPPLEGPRPRPAPAAPAGSYLLRSAPGTSILYVVGRWNCGIGRPAVLDARTGSVWVFGAWPRPRQKEPATYLATVTGATGLGVRTTGGPCDQLLVLRPDGPDLALTVPEAT
jgi:tRNA A-37 threonylcarbamoyl transferase component Bud32